MPALLVAFAGCSLLRFAHARAATRHRACREQVECGNVRLASDDGAIFVQELGVVVLDSDFPHQLLCSVPGAGLRLHRANERGKPILGDALTAQVLVVDDDGAKLREAVAVGWHGAVP